MDNRIKMALVALPIIATIAIAFTMVTPAYEEYKQKETAVNDKQKEKDELTNKLANHDAITNERKMLESEIESLRGSVPKSADVELLNIDVEKMCRESSMELISFRQANTDESKRVDDAATAVPDAGTNMSKGKEALANRVKATMNPGGSTPPKPDAKAGASDVGLAKVTMVIKVIGSYDNLMSLVKKLESYQRVVEVSEINTHVPQPLKNKSNSLPDDVTPGDSDPQGDVATLQSSLLITAYYLP